MIILASALERNICRVFLRLYGVDHNTLAIGAMIKYKNIEEHESCRLHRHAALILATKNTPYKCTATITSDIAATKVQASLKEC